MLYGNGFIYKLDDYKTGVGPSVDGLQVLMPIGFAYFAIDTTSGVGPRAVSIRKPFRIPESALNQYLLTPENYPYIPDPVYCFLKDVNLKKSVDTYPAGEVGEAVLVFDPDYISEWKQFGTGGIASYVPKALVKVLCYQELTNDTDEILVGWEHEIINLAADIALNNIESQRTQEHAIVTKS